MYVQAVAPAFSRPSENMSKPARLSPLFAARTFLLRHTVFRWAACFIGLPLCIVGAVAAAAALGSLPVLAFTALFN